MTVRPRVRASDPAEAVARAARTPDERRAELAERRTQAVSVVASDDASASC